MNGRNTFSQSQEVGALTVQPNVEKKQYLEQGLIAQKQMLENLVFNFFI
jgi:hypothetical protein